MKELHNKPRVFLSHCKTDKEFIENLNKDLQKCQIDIWLDEIDIRHGTPWLDAIFESGIPTCDCILFYLTDDSVKSPMVKKEIDASIIQKLSDNRVSLLPYVSDSSVREQLRPDLKALQIPVWNIDNYHELLPAVVAEIWHSYLESTIEFAVDREKQKNMDLKLELERIKGNDGEIFSSSEIKDFSYINENLDSYELTAFAVVNKETKQQKEIIKIEVNLLSLLPFISGKDNHTYSKRDISKRLNNILLMGDIGRKINEKTGFTNLSEIDIGDKLLLYGLIERKENPYFRRNPQSKFHMNLISSYIYVYSAKMERFKYWLAANDLLPTEVKWSIVEGK